MSGREVAGELGMEDSLRGKTHGFECFRFDFANLGRVCLDPERLDAGGMTAFLLPLTSINVLETGRIHRDRDANVDLILRRLRFWNEHGHDLFEEADTGITLLAKAETVQLAGLADVVDEWVNASTRIVDDTCRVVRLDDLETVVLRETVEPVVDGEGLAVVGPYLISARTCAVQST